MTTALIELDDVAVTYEADPPVPALKPVSLRIDRGEHVAIMGRSGSGKTTLLNVIGLLRRQTEGHYVLDGRTVDDLAERQRCQVRSAEIGFVFQAFHLLSDRSVLDNVATALLYQGVPGPQRRRRAAEVLDEVGMSHRAHFAPTQLSGGEQQRVVIARALATRPSILLCDEPTGDLDSRTAQEIVDLLQAQVAMGKTLVVITHDERVADSAERTLLMSDGALVT